MGRRLVNTVVLDFVEDINGVKGLIPQKVNKAEPESFNSFWDGRAIFHDVFEHYFEFSHKYFDTESSLNVGGEMVAMGAACYYYSKLGLVNREYESIYATSSFIEQAVDTTKQLVIESINEQNFSFGEILISKVPSQKPLDCESHLEETLERFWREVKDTSEFSEDSLKYKNSVTLGKILNLHRYGYRMAERLVPCCFSNMSNLYDFIDFWESFCKEDAEEYSNIYDQAEFKIYKEAGEISWSCQFTSKYIDIENLKVH